MGPPTKKDLNAAANVIETLCAALGMTGTDMEAVACVLGSELDGEWDDNLGDMEEAVWSDDDTSTRTAEMVASKQTLPKK